MHYNAESKSNTPNQFYVCIQTHMHTHNSHSSWIVIVGGGGGGNSEHLHNRRGSCECVFPLHENCFFPSTLNHSFTFGLFRWQRRTYVVRRMVIRRLCWEKDIAEEKHILFDVSPTSKQGKFYDKKIEGSVCVCALGLFVGYTYMHIAHTYTGKLAYDFIAHTETNIHTRADTHTSTNASTKNHFNGRIRVCSRPCDDIEIHIRRAHHTDTHSHIGTIALANQHHLIGGLIALCTNTLTNTHTSVQRVRVFIENLLRHLNRSLEVSTSRSACQWIQYFDVILFLFRVLCTILFHCALSPEWQQDSKVTEAERTRERKEKLRREKKRVSDRVNRVQFIVIVVGSSVNFILFFSNYTLVRCSTTVECVYWLK